MRTIARPVLVLASLSFSALSLWPGPAVAEDNCTPSRLLLVVDRSSSMKDTLLNQPNVSKWKAAQGALSSLVTKYEKSIDLGLMIFPNPDQCSPGKVVVEPGPSQAVAINAAIAGNPVPNAWTPMAQSVDAAAGAASLQDLTRRPAIVLVSDGWQWCDPYDAATRFTPVSAVQRARQKGISVYVVGFGSQVDVLTLNRMASAAGTNLPGCDPTGKDLNSPNKCYYQVDDQAQLDAALSAVAVQVSAEACDGVDNDCDGQIDEDVMRPCSTACGNGMETCGRGMWGECDAQMPAVEMCNGKDDDCDGTTDEGCDCKAGDTLPCGSMVGACEMGEQTCDVQGQWGDCMGGVEPGVETCNDIDDDCNGFVDDEGADPICEGGVACVAGVCQDERKVPLDGGLADGEGPPSEAETDAGTGGTPKEGCGCRVGARDGGPGALAITVVVAMALVLGRRRRGR